MKSTNPKILAFAGSTRKESFNRKVLNHTVTAAKNAGAEVDLLDLSAFELPLFNQDLEAEQGLPIEVLSIRKRFESADGLLIASPEYNGNITPLLKNLLDWLSRPVSENDPPYAAFSGKTCAIVSASPGRLGGIRSISQLRYQAGNLGLILFWQTHGVGGCNDEMFESDKFAESRDGKKLAELAEHFVEFTGRNAG